MATRMILPLIIFIMMLICATAQNQNIALDSVLVASQNSKWVSPNGQFAFGFRNITSTLYLLGIWFDHVPTKTLAWTPMDGQRDVPVEKKYTLQFSNSGLKLYDDQNNTKWSAGGDGYEITHAAMLNSGNFVLLNALSQPVWQSFDHPTDTLLPGQTLKIGSYMCSKVSATNYSTGRFQLYAQNDGNLVLYAMARRSKADGAYWASGVLSEEVSLKFDPSGLLYLVNIRNMTVKNLTEGEAGNGRFLRRVTLESDGILAQYVWNMDDNDSSWVPVWQPVTDKCKDVRGQCGINGICRLISHNNVDCICPPQFNFIDNDDHFKGCMRNTSQGQSCSSASSNMSRLDNTDWRDGNYEVLLNLSEMECQEECMKDCMCIVVIYGPTACLKKRMPLLDGRQGTNVTDKAFLKVFKDFNVQSDFPPFSMRNEREGKTLVEIGIILLACFSSLLSAASLVICLCRSELHKIRKFIQHYNSVEGLKTFSYKEIEAATGGFRQELGRGSFGKVYKGALPDGREIAVKTLVDTVEQEEHGEREFRTEMNVIGTSHHKNLVQLYGFCDEGSHRILVYEYMSNGSLDRALFVDSGFLDWSVRVQIAMGIAKGIRYLHEECRTQILHCDIKPQNILLDENYSPKISDFGLAKLLRAEQTRTFTAARGTRGYIAPEWIDSVPVTVKVDVYSFGMMLLEIICCRKTVKLDVQDNKAILVEWVYECLERGSVLDLVAQQQVEGVTIESRQLERMVLVGLWCIQEHPHLRPSINNVVHMMEGRVEIAVPPPPVPPPAVLPPLGSLSISGFGAPY